MGPLEDSANSEGALDPFHALVARFLAATDAGMNPNPEGAALGEGLGLLGPACADVDALEPLVEPP